MSTIAKALLNEFESAIRSDRAFDPFLVADLLPSDDEPPEIEVVASTSTSLGLMVHIYLVTESDGERVCVASEHSDGGVCVGWKGPAISWAELKSAYPTSEGWTNY
jgi:hypothetical protein